MGTTPADRPLYYLLWNYWTTCTYCLPTWHFELARHKRVDDSKGMHHVMSYTVYIYSAGSNPCLAAMLEHWNSSKTTDAGRGCQVQFTLDLPLKADWHPCRQYGWLPHAWSIDRATQLVRYMLAKIALKSLGISLQKYRRDRLHKIYYHPPLPCVHVVHDSSCSLNGWLVFLISLKMN